LSTSSLVPVYGLELLLSPFTNSSSGFKDELQTREEHLTYRIQELCAHKNHMTGAVILLNFSCVLPTIYTLKETHTFQR
jgi:hypothetical protein